MSIKWLIKFFVIRTKVWLQMSLIFWLIYMIFAVAFKWNDAFTFKLIDIGVQAFRLFVYYIVLTFALKGYRKTLSSFTSKKPDLVEGK